LRDAINGLYQTFSRYTLPPHVDDCPHCVSDSDHAFLYAEALLDLTADQLARYTFKAMTTWSDEDDFRHFLPRIFELIVAYEDSRIDPEVIFGKLAYGHWEAWEFSERQSIISFFEAFWCNVLDHFPHRFFSAEGCLCCLAQAAENLSSYLARWHIARSLAHAKHFASFIQYDLARRSTIRELRIEGEFWARRPAAATPFLTGCVYPFAQPN
jgi:hypothetical protein